MSKITKDIAKSLSDELARQASSLNKNINLSQGRNGSEEGGYINPVSEQTPSKSNSNEMVSPQEDRKQKETMLYGGDGGEGGDIGGNASGGGGYSDNQYRLNTGTDDVKTKKPKDRQLWRDLTAYWILGLCNNYGYVVMLSAAHDIIKQFNSYDDNSDGVEADSGRKCQIASTGTILLADILPALMAKFIGPFIPLWVHVRVFVAIALAAGGFLLVAFADTAWMAMLGVISTSFGCGLGETTFLAYTSKFNKDVISTWSSGTGGAGVIGSLSYAALKSINIGPVTTMLIMLVVPALEAIAFWGLLRRPSKVPKNLYHDPSYPDFQEINDDEKPLMSIKEKLKYALYLMRYMIPLGLVYLFEYFINQGLFELVYFEDTFLDKDSQYRWLNVDYQIGVFLSRSSVNVFTINKIWLMALFQCFNVIYFALEVLFYFTPSIWIVFVIVLWEGLLGGGAYVNTFYKMSKEISSVRQPFAMGIVTQADSFGIAIAGFSAIPIHNLICQLPKPIRSFTF